MSLGLGDESVSVCISEAKTPLRYSCVRTGSSGAGAGSVDGRTWNGTEKTLRRLGVPLAFLTAEKSAIDMVYEIRNCAHSNDGGLQGAREMSAEGQTRETEEDRRTHSRSELGTFMLRGKT